MTNLGIVLLSYFLIFRHEEITFGFSFGCADVAGDGTGGHYERNYYDGS